MNRNDSNLNRRQLAAAIAALGTFLLQGKIAGAVPAAAGGSLIDTCAEAVAGPRTVAAIGRAALAERLRTNFRDDVLAPLQAEMGEAATPATDRAHLLKAVERARDRQLGAADVVTVEGWVLARIEVAICAAWLTQAGAGTT